MLEYNVCDELSTVRMDDAAVIIEELQASPEDFPAFLSNEMPEHADEEDPEAAKPETSDTERELLQCRTEEDFRRFALRRGATCCQKKRWVVNHACGARSTMSPNPNPNKTRETMMKMRKEFRRIYIGS